MVFRLMAFIYHSSGDGLCSSLNLLAMAVASPYFIMIGLEAEYGNVLCIYLAYESAGWGKFVLPS